MPVFALLRFWREGLAVLLIIGVGFLWTMYKTEKALKEKAQRAAATSKLASEISQQMAINWQDIAEIKSKAANRRGKLNALQKNNDLDGLADDFNAPGAGGVRSNRTGHPQGGAQAPARYHAAEGAPATYQEAP
jgi:hypothetical protein